MEYEKEQMNLILSNNYRISTHLFSKSLFTLLIDELCFECIMNQLENKKNSIFLKSRNVGEIREICEVSGENGVGEDSENGEINKFKASRDDRESDGIPIPQNGEKYKNVNNISLAIIHSEKSPQSQPHSNQFSSQENSGSSILNTKLNQNQSHMYSDRKLNENSKKTNVSKSFNQKSENHGENEHSSHENDFQSRKRRKLIEGVCDDNRCGSFATQSHKQNDIHNSKSTEKTQKKKKLNMFCTCLNCTQKISSTNYAPHLQKCMINNNGPSRSKKNI